MSDDDRTTLLRLLPDLAERDLPGDRRERLEESLMNRIENDRTRTSDRQPADRPHPRPARRVPALAAAAVAVVAVGTAAAVGVAALAPGAGTNDHVGRSHDRSDHSGAVTSLSGRQVLLAAATSAARTPQPTGRYWHVAAAVHDPGGKTDVYEMWKTRDGRTWYEDGKGGAEYARRAPYTVGAADLTTAAIRRLPADPDALKARFRRAAADPTISFGGAPPNAAERHVLEHDALVALVSGLPATPKVRAAAFRALASYPDVRVLGVADGAYRLRIGTGPRSQVIGVDRDSGLIRHSDFYLRDDGGKLSAAPGGYVDIRDGWVDRLPR